MYFSAYMPIMIEMWHLTPYFMHKGIIQMNLVFTFGFKLAELTKQSEAASIGLISLAIIDAGRNPQQMSYQDFMIVFQYHLPRRLEKLNLPDCEKITGQMLQYLAHSNLFS
jgi:hypothetical protein